MHHIIIRPKHKKKKRRIGDGERKATTLPRDQEGLVQAIVDVDDQVVVGHALDLRPWKLTIDQDPLAHIPHQTKSKPLNHKKKKKNNHITPLKKHKTQRKHLLFHTQRIDVSVCHVPSKEPVGVLCIDKSRENEEG